MDSGAQADIQRQSPCPSLPPTSHGTSQAPSGRSTRGRKHPHRRSLEGEKRHQVETEWQDQKHDRDNGTVENNIGDVETSKSKRRVRGRIATQRQVSKRQKEQRMDGQRDAGLRKKVPARLTGTSNEQPAKLSASLLTSSNGGHVSTAETPPRFPDSTPPLSTPPGPLFSLFLRTEKRRLRE